MTYNFKRAIVVSVAGQFISLILALIYQSFLVTNETNWERLWSKLVMVALNLCVLSIITIIYYRNTDIIPTAKSGFYLGITYALISVYIAANNYFDIFDDSTDMVARLISIALVFSYVLIACSIGFVKSKKPSQIQRVPLN